MNAVPLALGGDISIIPDYEMNNTYYGATKNIGIGTPGYEFHAEWGETETWQITQFNIFSVADTVYDRIMEW